MKILAVSALDCSHESGPVLHFLAVADRWRRLGHEVKVLAWRVADSAPQWQQGADSGGDASSPGRKIRRALRAEACAALDRDKPDVLYLRGGLSGIATEGARRGIPVVVEINGVLSEELRVSGAPFLVRWLQLRRERRTLALSRGVVAVSDQTRDAMVRENPGVAAKCRVIPNGCETSGFARCGREMAASRGPRLVFIGGIHGWTRLHLAVDAMRELPEFTLDVIGDGGGLEGLKRHADTCGVAERVHFLGRLRHSEIPSILAKAAIGLGNFEPDHVDAGSALKLSEYLAAGVCPLTRANPALGYIESERLGRLLHGEVSAESIAQAIRDIAAHGELLAESAILRRIQYSEAHLDWTSTAGKILAFFGELGIRGTGQPKT